MLSAESSSRRTQSRLIPRAGNHRSRGLNLIECMMLLLVFSIVSVATGVALQSISLAPAIVESRLWTAQQIASKIESMRDTSYAALLSGSATTEADFNGRTYTISWTVTEIDPANPTASPAVAKAGSGLKQLVVSLNGQSFTTWVSQ